MDKQIVNFLIKAKRATYAVKRAETTNIYECVFRGGLVE